MSALYPKDVRACTQLQGTKVMQFHFSQQLKTRVISVYKKVKAKIEAEVAQLKFSKHNFGSENLDNLE